MRPPRRPRYSVVAKSGEHPWPYGEGEIIFRSSDADLIARFLDGLLEWLPFVFIVDNRADVV